MGTTPSCYSLEVCQSGVLGPFHRLVNPPLVESVESLLFGVCLAAGHWEVCILRMCRQELKWCNSLGDKRVLGGDEGSLMEVLSSVAG